MTGRRRLRPRNGPILALRPYPVILIGGTLSPREVAHDFTLGAALRKEVPPQQAPPRPSPISWIGIVALLVTLVVVGAGIWLPAPDDAFTIEDLAVLEDQVVPAEDPLPSVPGMTLQEFALAEDRLLARGNPTIPASGITVEEFAQAEDMIGR